MKLAVNWQARDDARVAEITRLEEIVRRQGRAVEAGIEALTQLGRTGSLRKTVREEALRKLIESRNERLRLDP